LISWRRNTASSDILKKLKESRSFSVGVKKIAILIF
jgi:hypothetical protein